MKERSKGRAWVLKERKNALREPKGEKRLLPGCHFRGKGGGQPANFGTGKDGPRWREISKIRGKDSRRGGGRSTSLHLE